MSEKCILAVDPGLTGALAFIFPVQDAVSVDAVLAARQMPRERKPKADKPPGRFAAEKAAAPLDERGGREFDDQIPF